MMDIKKLAISVNKSLPEKYLRRNTHQYEYVSYVNHIISFYLSEQWNSCQWFIKRAIELERSNTLDLDETYLEKVNQLIAFIIQHLQSEQLILNELKSKFHQLGIINDG